MKFNPLLKLCCALALSIVIVNFVYAVYGKRISIDQQTIGYEVKPWYKYHKNGKPGREVMLYFGAHKRKDSLLVSISCEGERSEYVVVPTQPIDSLAVLLPPNTGIKATKAALTLTSGNNTITETIAIPAKKQWTVYIYPHSHVDIGYTNLQDTVEKLHIRNIDVGIDIANQTKDYPSGAKFVWNPEATWVVSQYLKKADAKQKATLINAVKKGWLQIDAAYANINTSTCSDEELLRMFKDSRAIEDLTGVPINTMVQMDNPGATWGMVQAAVANGIEGFFSFPNYFDLRHRWENKPFYWQGQDGKSKLFYLQATSYGYGFKAKGRIYGLGKIQALTPEYDRLTTDNPSANFIDPFIFEETAQLERRNSPYDIFAMTWSMADNCLIDADLPEAVKLWNQKYAYPKLIIAGTKEILAAYEEKFKEIIPTYRGDLSEFWTQGLGSDAKSVAKGRKGKEDLVQAETLWPMLNIHAIAPIQQFNSAWEMALLSAEHTWGYQDPNAPLAKKVEANKAAYFTGTLQQADSILHLALQPIQKKGTNSFAVINTLSWPRDGIVILTPEQSVKGDRMVDEQNNPVISQRLTTGELAFEAKEIPALGSRFFKILPGKAKAGSTMYSENTLNNQLISVTLDAKNGNITSFIDLLSKREIVDQKSTFGFNGYNYLEGVKNGSISIGGLSKATAISIKVKENGPLIASIVVNSQAKGCKWLQQEVKITKNQPYLELINTLDKIATRTKEGIHYSFPFNVPKGTIKIDIPFGVMTPEMDQIPYSNKNWFSFQRWIDISNEDYGITWTSIQAPIVEFGDITGTILDGARLAGEWIKKLNPTQTLVSWPVNNHWDTNFPLEQSGIIAINYFILPHKGGYDPAIANQFGMSKHRPLILVETDRNPIKKPLFSLNNQKIMVSTIKKSEDNKAIIVNLRSISSDAEKLSFHWLAQTPKAMYSCQPNEEIITKQNDVINMLPYSTYSFRIEF